MAECDHKAIVYDDKQVKINIKTELKPDLVVLSVSSIPNKDNEKLAGLLNVSLDGEGYFKEAISR